MKPRHKRIAQWIFVSGIFLWALRYSAENQEWTLFSLDLGFFLLWLFLCVFPYIFGRQNL